MKKELEEEFCNSLKKFATISWMSVGKTSIKENTYSGDKIPEKLIAFIREIKKGNMDKTKK